MIEENNWKESPGNEDNHYEGEIQPIEFIEGRNLFFTEGNVIKYLSRYKKKAGKLDLEKALWYINRVIEKTDGKNLTEEYSVQEYIDSQGFSKLEAEILQVYMGFFVDRNSSDLFRVRALLKELIEKEYGSDS